MSYIREMRSLIGHQPLVVAGAVVLIIDIQNRLLLQHRIDNHQWGLIGGSMEIGESLEETARREVFEETGLKLDKLDWFDLFSGQELIYKYPNQDIVANVVAVYITRQFNGKLKADKYESDELCFFDLKSLPKDLNPPDKPIVDRFLSMYFGNIFIG
jgi:8-oxo-dGTP pyrophosphatase MutT (NUDIX family)